MTKTRIYLKSTTGIVVTRIQAEGTPEVVYEVVKGLPAQYVKVLKIGNSRFLLEDVAGWVSDEEYVAGL